MAWGNDGHSIIAEIAQRRLSPQARAAVERVLGKGVSLASVASWADDVREERPATASWHFVNIPLAQHAYDAAEHCRPGARGDCVIAALERLQREVPCAPTRPKRAEALRFAVHFVGDLHQPLHTVEEDLGGNLINVQLAFTELKCRRNCTPLAFQRNFHALWDDTLVNATARNWGAYVERLEKDLLKRPDIRQADRGAPRDWALESHAHARHVWTLLPLSREVDDQYYRAVLPILDRQLAVAGLRLARFLNEAYSKPPTSCAS